MIRIENSRRLVSRACSAILALGTVVAAAMSAAPAAAQNFPTKPLRIVIPYGPAGAVDIAPRLLAEKMAADLGQPVLIENKPGGMGLPAVNDVLSAPADGYSILAADAGTWAIIPALQTVPYDFLRDFAPVSLTFSNGLLIITGTASGINTLQDLIAQAKAKPGVLNFGSPGIGTLHHLTFEVLRSSLGMDMKHVPYQGAAPVVESALRGDTQVGMASLSAVMPHVKAGKIKILAVNITTRLRQIPDVPTVGEITGLKDFHFPGQQGLVVKAGTPKAIVDKLAASIRKGALHPDVFNKVLEGSASEMTPNTPEQLTELIRGDIKKFANAVKVSGAKPL